MLTMVITLKAGNQSMASELKVDTISEKTTNNGITIDGVTIKDGSVQGYATIGLVIALGD